MSAVPQVSSTKAALVKEYVMIEEPCMVKGLKRGLLKEFSESHFFDPSQVSKIEQQLDNILKTAVENLRPEFVELTEQTYTEEELSYSLEFYRNPLGMSILEKTICMLPEKLPSLVGKLQKAIVGKIAKIFEDTAAPIEKSDEKMDPAAKKC